jgi:hypothetical protein
MGETPKTAVAPLKKGDFDRLSPLLKGMLKGIIRCRKSQPTTFQTSSYIRKIKYALMFTITLKNY